MTATHIHLMVTHLPIFGSILGAIVLMIGIYAKSAPTKMAAYVLFVLSALGALTANFTGEEAEETVEHLPGVIHNMIHEHEEAAELALISLLFLGAMALVGIFFSWKNSPIAGKLSFVILIISLLSFGLVARAGYLGGQIRHSEIRSGATTQDQGNGQEKGGEKDDDD